MANFNFNKIMLGGRLTADPENKQTADGTSVTTFTVAVNRRSTAADGKPIADFFKIVARRALADFVYKFFRRGSAIFVLGTVQNRSYIDHEGTKRYITEIIADEVSFVDSKSDTPSTAARSPFPDSGEGNMDAGSDSARTNTNGEYGGTFAGSTEKPAPLPSDFFTADQLGKGDDDLPF